MKKEYEYKVNFDDEKELDSYGKTLLDGLDEGLEKLKKDYIKSGHFSYELLQEQRSTEIELGNLITEGREQLTDYMISSILEIDKYSKEDIMIFKNKVNTFSNRLKYIDCSLEDSNEKMWDMMASPISKGWRVK